MQSEAGSGFFDNCTCADAYYNNGTRCEDCSVDHFCVVGKQHACPSQEWTNGLTRQDACRCRPTFMRAGTQCVPCADNFFCDGTDDSQQQCPENSISNNAHQISQCLCNASFEVLHSNNATEPHSCPACPSDFFKLTVGNTPCLACRRCLPDTDSVWTRIVCDSAYNALCDSCTVCHNASAVGTPAEQWASVGCQEFVDTDCSDCVHCDYTEEWERTPCGESSDRVCGSITRERDCSVGEYAGNHSRSSDSLCLPCAMNDTLYEDQRLHYYTSKGRLYNDPTSCDVACHPFSRLRNPAAPVLGCVSCEVGNVLFKVFTQNDSACTFTCLPGYVLARDDCELAPMQASVSSFWNHSLNVTHVRHVAVDGDAAFRFTVSHTSHGHFVVVVGQRQPSCVGRVHAHERPACCFGGLWRVSSKTQLGLASNTQETCSAAFPPSHSRISDGQLEFDVPDSRLPEFALCHAVLNTSNAELACVLHVSIVDAVLLHHFSVAVPLELRRGAALAFVPGTHTYAPLLSFHAEVQLAYFDAGLPVFLVVSSIESLPTAGVLAVLLSSNGLDLVHPPVDVNCGRYAAHEHNSSMDSWNVSRAPQRASTFLRAPSGTHLVKLAYTIRLLERERTAVGNMMTVAVWRNLSLAHAVCQTAQLPVTTRTGEVLSCSGLGDAAVSAATALQDASQTVHGELGGLTSFVARALHSHVHRVQALSILASFALPPATSLLAANVYSMREGYLDFTESFRAACAATALCHFRYIQLSPGVHFMSSCDSASQDGARTWLRRTLGVAHDAGHVQALCALVLGRPYAFSIVLVNSRAYLPRTVQWHDLQNKTAPQSTSSINVVFKFH